MEFPSIFGFEMAIVLFVTLFLPSSLAQETFCVSFGQTTVCDSSATWAINTPNLTVTHNITPTVSPLFLVTYETLVNSSSSTLCSYTVGTGRSCTFSGSGCSGCVNDLDTSGRLITTFFLADLDVSFDQATVQYTISKASILDMPLFQLNLAECNKSEGNAVATTSQSPCGYGCVSNFTCAGDFTTNQMYDRTYSCAETATWTPSGLESLCVSETTQPATVSEAESAANTWSTYIPTTGNSTGPPGQIPCIVLTVLGCVFMLTSVCSIVVIACNEIPDDFRGLFWVAVGLLISGFIPWLIGIILCFVTGDGSSDHTGSQIAGIVLAAAGIACLFASAVIAIYINVRACNGNPPDQNNRGQKPNSSDTGGGCHVGPQRGEGYTSSPVDDKNANYRIPVDEDVTRSAEGTKAAPNKKGQGSQNPKKGDPQSQGPKKKRQESHDVHSHADKSVEKEKTSTYEHENN